MLCGIMLSVFILNVIMLSDYMLMGIIHSVIMLNAFLQNDITQCNYTKSHFECHFDICGYEEYMLSVIIGVTMVVC